MTSETYVVAYECVEDDESVLDYAIASAKKTGAGLHIVHILEWSPYTFLTPQEIEERHGRRKEELTRAKEALREPAMARVKAAGVPVDGEIRYGSIAELVVAITKEVNGTMIYVGRSGMHSISARVFGSVPLGLAQIAHVPTVIVP